MHTWRRLIIGGVVSATCLFVPPLRAEYPPYLILRTPSAPVPHKPSYGYYPGYGYPVEAQSFSYGWFGAQPRSHAARHFGYYRDYTEWSWK